MNTSESTRVMILFVLLGLGCIVVCANILIAARLVSGRKVGRWSKVVWPILLTLGVLSVVDAFCWEPDWVQATHHTIQTPKLSASSRLRIVQLTDLHLTGGLTKRELRATRIVNSFKPDVIVLTGDYTSEKTPLALSALTRMGRMLSDIAPTYAVEGNWDAPEDIAALRKSRITYLGRWIRIRCRGGGMAAMCHAEWYGGAIEPIPTSCKKLFTIALCHRPRHFERLQRAGIDLVLAGHTHGGQVRLPVIGALLPERRLVGKYQAGFYKVGGGLMYVNRGLGCEGVGAPAIRFFCRPEVAAFDIVGSNK